MTLPVEGYQLKGISPKAYEHPADRAATASLQSIPYLDRVVRKLIELGYERALRQAYLGASVRLGEDQLPNLWGLQVRAYRTLDLEPVPDLYLTQQLIGLPGQAQIPNAVTIGSRRPIVVMQSGLVTLLREEELFAVLAHEAGHVLSDHTLYATALAIILRLSRLMLDLGVTHPMPVRRVHELTQWVASGEYDRIVGGSYQNRTDPVRPRAEAGDAVAHYAERFKTVFRDAGESINDVGKQLSDWLRGPEKPGGGDAT